jgi:cysteine synthase B
VTVFVSQENFGMTDTLSTTQIAVQLEPVVAPPLAGGLEAAVGNTPLLPLRRVTAGLSPHVQVLAKAEWFNPGGSIKDRPALKSAHSHC